MVSPHPAASIVLAKVTCIAMNSKYHITIAVLKWQGLVLRNNQTIVLPISWFLCLVLLVVMPKH